MLDELAVAAERIGLVARAVQRGRIATRPRSCCGDWSTPMCSSTRTSLTGPPGSARRPPSWWAVDGSRPGPPRARTRRRRQRMDRCDADGAVQEGDLGQVFSTATAAGRPSTPSWTSSGGSRRKRAPPSTGTGRAGLCVLADAVVPEPTRLAALHRDRVAHLPVRLRDGTDRRATGAAWPVGVPRMRGATPVRPRPRLAGRRSTARRATRPRQRRRGGGNRALGVAQVLAALDVAGGRGAATPPVLGATLELDLAGEYCATVAGAPGLHVWRTTARADMRAARRTGESRVMSAARPLK